MSVFPVPSPRVPAPIVLFVSMMVVMVPRPVLGVSALTTSRHFPIVSRCEVGRISTETDYVWRDHVDRCLAPPFASGRVGEGTGENTSTSAEILPASTTGAPAPA